MKLISTTSLIVILAFMFQFANAQKKGTFERSLFIEEFTTESCGYCPAAAQRIEKAIEECNDPNRVIWICHHAGFGTDWLTVSPESTGLLWFYGGSTFAPAVMWDRTKITGTVPVMGVASSVATIKNTINNRLDTPAPMSISIVGSSFNEISRELSIKVSGEFGETLEGDIMLNVYLSEDSIKAHNQSGGIPSATAWIHHNVLRHVVTSTWGEIIENTVEGATFEKTYSVIIPDKYSTGANDVDINLDNFKLVAFVSRYDSSDRNNCEVFNATQSFIKDLSSLVELHGVCIFGLEGAEYTLTGAGIYVPGTEVTVSASATYEGKELPFIYWGDVDGIEMSNKNSYTFNAVGSHILYAYFGKPSGVENKITDMVKIYPNPAKNSISINGDYNNLEMYNSVGKLVLSSSYNNNIDITTLSNGVYIIKVSGDNGTQVERIVIKK